MNKWIYTVFCFVLSLLLFGCSSSIHETQYDIPKEGTWYCSELNVHLVFDMEFHMVKNSYAVVDGMKITCECSGEFNTPYVFLRCRQSDGVYKQGDTLYWWRLAKISDDEMILEDYYSGEEFTFKKISITLD